MTTMTALRAHRRGGPEVLTVERTPVPVPARGEALVAVHAAAITFDELTWPETWTHIPVIPSHEVSGVVTAVADDVTEVAVGDEVYGLIRFDRDGAAAEYVTVPAADLAHRPVTVSHVEAAALPLAGLTAWQALVDHAKTTPGERVLVLGGTGGVGVFTVQLAHRFGAEVTATVRKNVAVTDADHVIDVRTEAVPARAYDVVVDTVGGAALTEAATYVRPGGRVITLSAPPDEGIDATFFIVVPDRQQLRQLAELVDAGRLQIPVADTFALDDGRAAFESGRLPGRRAGKTVIRVVD